MPAPALRLVLSGHLSSGGPIALIAHALTAWDSGDASAAADLLRLAARGIERAAKEDAGVLARKLARVASAIEEAKTIEQLRALRCAVTGDLRVQFDPALGAKFRERERELAGREFGAEPARTSPAPEEK